MRIAFVSQALDSVLPPKQNSVGIWTYQTALRLAPRHEVLVVSRGGKGLPTRSERDGIRFDFVPVLPGRLWDAAGRARRALLRGTQFFARPYYRAEYVAQCIRRLRAFNPDVIHIHNFVNHIPAWTFPPAIVGLFQKARTVTPLDPTAERTARTESANTGPRLI
jgi:glycosyltransferase involved in cell wall biosynthesis